MADDKQTPGGVTQRFLRIATGVSLFLNVVAGSAAARVVKPANGTRPHTAQAQIPINPSWVVLDPQGNQVAGIGNQPDEGRSTASLAKLMAVYVTLDQIVRDKDTPDPQQRTFPRLLDTLVHVPREAMIPQNSMGLRPGEKTPLIQLIKGALVGSYNDAATAFGVATAGSIPAIAERMNQQARELGLLSTQFVNPSGQDILSHDPQYNRSTAMEMARLVQLLHTRFAGEFGNVLRPESVTYGGVTRQNIEHDILDRSVKGLGGPPVMAKGGEGHAGINEVTLWPNGYAIAIMGAHTFGEMHHVRELAMAETVRTLNKGPDATRARSVPPVVPKTPGR